MVFAQQIVQGSRNFAEILDETLIETSMAKKGMDLFNWGWRRQFWDYFNFGIINFNPLLENNVSEHDSLMNHEMALLPT